MSFSRTFHTARHVKPSQLAWRVWYSVRRRFNSTVPAAPADVAQSPTPTRIPEVEVPAWDQTDIEALASGNFTFFNKTMTLGKPDGQGRGAMDWKLGNQSADRLWIISLHYHSWLYKLALAGIDPKQPGQIKARETFELYLDDWIANVSLAKPGSRALAWNAYAVASRLTWWAQLLWLPDVDKLITAERKKLMLSSAWQQASFLEHHLEYDLRANHLLRDMIGLVYAGRLLSGPDGLRWLKKGSRLGVEQVREQVLSDGGHFERSPMYHIHVMGDVLALACLAETDEQRQEMTQTWLKMAQALKRLTHPDGLVALFNDGGFNGSETPAQAVHAGETSLKLKFEDSPLKPLESLDEFGMIRLANQEWTTFFDVGPIGVDYQPGHAHADTLSLEASFRGQRLIVDPGSMVYDNGPTRQYDRATQSHNTVCIDNQNSSEVWHIFRVARRARPLDVSYTTQDQSMHASATHDGYDRLPGKPRHARAIKLDDQGLTVIDTVTRAKGRLLSSAWLLSPDAKVTRDDRGVLITTSRGVVRVSVICDSQTAIVTVEEANYHPSMGQEIRSSRIKWTLQNQSDRAVVTTIFKPE